LSAYSHVSQPTISQLESGGIQDITGEMLSRLAKALDTTTDYLLGLTDDPRRPDERDYETVAEGINNLIDKAAEIRRHLKGEGGANDQAGRG
jgi:transcriptional regulator with XRE-family HTH domain